MKKYIFYILILFNSCFSTVSFAQITITESSAPTATENIMYYGSNHSIDVKTTGPNSTWDFSSVTPTEEDTYKFAAPKDINIIYTVTYFGDLGLDLKNPNIKNMFAFFKTSASDFRQVGLGMTLPILNVTSPLPYSSDDIVYRFPMKYGNIDSCKFGGTATIAGIKASIWGKRVDTVDGWGTIITPFKTYNCLRLKSVVIELDTLATIPQDNSRIEYKWISAVEHIPVFQANVLYAGGIPGSMHTYYRDNYRNNLDPNGSQVDFSVKDTAVFTKDTVFFKDKTKNLDLISWIWNILPNNYSYVGGTNSASQNPKVIFNSPGTYTVSLKGTDSAQIVNMMLKTNYITVTHNTGIANQPPIENKMLIYPNPSNGNIYLHLDKYFNGRSGRMTLSNATGQEIYSESFECGVADKALNLKNIVPGLYFINLQLDDFFYESKVVIN